MLTLPRAMTAGNVFVKVEARYNNMDQIGKNIKFRVILSVISSLLATSITNLRLMMLFQGLPNLEKKKMDPML